MTAGATGIEDATAIAATTTPPAAEIATTTMTAGATGIEDATAIAATTTPPATVIATTTEAATGTGTATTAGATGIEGATGIAATTTPPAAGTATTTMTAGATGIEGATGIAATTTPPATVIATTTTGAASTTAARLRRPGIREELEPLMSFQSICVVGDGRVGRAVSARLRERDLTVRTTTREPAWDGADLVLLCVPDKAIAGAAARIPEGPWVAHVSGATTLDALAPHTRRLSVHPLQTFVLERGPEQLDGIWSAVSGESPEALETGFALAELLGLRPFELADSDRPLYHAGAAFAAPFLVTLHQVASEIFREVGAPPEALEPLMRRTMENGFEPTGPHRRGDWSTVDRHLAVIHERHPEIEALYRALSDATAARPT